MLAGALLTTLLAATALAQPTQVLFVLDASGSMDLKLDDGRYRIAAAKDALTRFVARLPDDPDLDVGLRVYGATPIAYSLEESAIASFEGMGTFESANSSAELASALGRAVGAEVDATHRVTVTLTREGEPVAEDATVRFVDAVSGDVISLVFDADGAYSATLPAASYRAEVADAFGPEPLVIGGLSVTPEGENAFAFELAPAAEVAFAIADWSPEQRFAGPFRDVFARGRNAG